MSNKSKALIALILASVFGGAVSTIVKLSLKSIPPFTFSFIRFFIASICFLPLLIKRKPKLNSDLLKLFLISLFAVGNIFFFVLGIKLTTASAAQLLYAGVPLLAVLIGYFIFRNKISRKKLIYISIGVFGVFLVIFLPVIQKSNVNVGNLTGNLLIATAVLSWSIYAVLSKSIQKKFSPLAITAMFCFASAMVFLLLMLTELNQTNVWWTKLNVQGIIGVLYVGIIGTVGTYLLNQYAFKYADAVMGSLNMYLMPIFAYFFAYILLGEKLTEGLIIGTVIVFISIALTTYSR